MRHDFFEVGGSSKLLRRRFQNQTPSPSPPFPYHTLSNAHSNLGR